MKVSVGYSDIYDSTVAGRKAAQDALDSSGRDEPCDIALLFCTVRHKQEALRDAVSSTLGAEVPIFGGETAGIITDCTHGYAADQACVACIWLDDSRCNVLTDGGLFDGEGAAGLRLGKELKKVGVTPESSVMLLYDAVRQNSEDLQPIMSTWLLSGLESGLGFLPDLTGAGLRDERKGAPVKQFVGNKVAQHSALAFVFSDDIRIDNAIIRGSRPASPCYTVTKAQGCEILEIDDKPALEFLQELLGQSVNPEQYPFFLSLGMRPLGCLDEYDEDNCAVLLCTDIDTQHSSIIMSEPDIAEGVQFQLVYRSEDFDHMKSKIETIFKQVENENREPVFAMYINCADRSSGFRSADDATALQQAVAGRVPVLGFYTGVQIASVANRPKGLNRTGVFCLFSKGKSGKGSARKTKKRVNKQNESNQFSSDLESKLKKMCVQNAAKILELDARATTLRYELELKRRGFNLLSDLAASLKITDDYERVFSQVARSINYALNMQKTTVMLSDGMGSFVPTAMHGFSTEETRRLAGRTISLPTGLLGKNSVVVTKNDDPELFSDFRQEFNLPFFISSPVILNGETAALVLTGRMTEEVFYPQLETGDLETIHAIARLLSSMLVRMRLLDITRKAETDALTGLWNRSAFQAMVEARLKDARRIYGVFMMVDIDHFKKVNDTYGHAAGDNALNECADAMRAVIRDVDLIGRQGGDEFVMFCSGISDPDLALKKAAQIQEKVKHNCEITISVGIAMYPQHGETFMELFKNADIALYKAKERGRNCCVLFDEQFVNK